MKFYKAVLFDMDGTVLDTLTDLTDSLSAVFKSRGLPVLTREKVRANLGYGYSGLMKSLAPDASEEERARMAEDFKQDYAIRCRRHTCPYDGIPEALQYLKSKGYRLAVVSNKGQEAVTTLHNKFFRNYAEFSLGETSAIPKKPDPQMLLEALRRFNLTPAEAVYVGDSEVDFQTAQNAGTDVILVTWGFRDKDFLARLKPTFLINRPSELTSIL